MLDKHKMGKHYDLTITDASFAYRCRIDAIAAEARLDGIYVIRTNVPETTLTAEQAVGAYKSLHPLGGDSPRWPIRPQIWASSQMLHRLT